mmetsp:Transcript_11131/g.16350  ORF Transcript_11131/g.16350 Transcript_11131/m.16350 type:complete len:661 (+) Transcript_11131:231-2213(+)
MHLVILFTILVVILRAESFLVEPSSSLRQHKSFLNADVDDSGSRSYADGIGVGIDLGTTHSAVSILEDGIPRILKIEGNGRTMPSVVHIDGDTVFVGKEAIEKEVSHPLGTYRNFKRVIGLGELAARVVASIVPNLELRLLGKDPGKKKRKLDSDNRSTGDVEDARAHPAMLLSAPDKNGKRSSLAPEVVSSHILRQLFNSAESQTGEKVNRAVVGVPAYFNEEQRQATVRACNLAGVDKVKLLREPEAAALSYGIGIKQMGKRLDDVDELVLVFDLGGGTFDVSFLYVGGNLFDVLYSGGNAMLGGSDLDYSIAEHFNKIIRRHDSSVGKSFLKIPEVADAMVRAAEAVRIYLSSNREAHLALPLTRNGWTSLSKADDIILTEKVQGLTEAGTATESHALFSFRRKTMEVVCDDVLHALLRPIREAAITIGAMLPGDTAPGSYEAAVEFERQYEEAMGFDENESRKNPIDFNDFFDEDWEEKHHDIDKDIILELKQIDAQEGKKKKKQSRRRTAKELVKEEKKYRQEVQKIKSKLPKNAKLIDGIDGEIINQVILVGGATKTPAIGRMLATLTGVVPKRTVNPDEAVALGCAVQLGVLDGDEKLEGLRVISGMEAAFYRAKLRDPDNPIWEMPHMKQKLPGNLKNLKGTTGYVTEEDML